MSETGTCGDPLAPPTSGVPEIEVPQSKWPTLIGVAGIVLAAAGLLCNSAGYFHLAFHRMGVEWQAKAGAPNPAAEVQLVVAQQFNMFWMISVTLAIGLSVWLLIGSITLVRRRRSARTLMIAYAMTSLPFVAIDMTLQTLMLQAAVAELSRRDASQHAGEVWMNAGIGGFFTIVFGVGFQVFLLVWFSRAKIRAEVASWRV